MTDKVLASPFEHGNWAKACMIEVRLTVAGEQLEAQPNSVAEDTKLPNCFVAQLRLDESRP